jgi:hypothetical protein
MKKRSGFRKLQALRSKRMMHCNLSEGLLLKVQEEQVRVWEL